ncbi:MAG: oxidoreductase domain-containing protein [Chlorobi bacterium OLB4]|jgi:predicted dehydrogenase/threonine dehydrogenase-like Zn-dependent dehydrogenase|nr:MAG: oxidoreductase domain-containing protein [Chlorobi bacterium OLB4]MBW7856235.1 bi-domain-containing oxidoreductase [Ignavibacteria bacterium]OQY77951.1 MAG: oxidoreductase [Ignavibacteriales bacterium UTCHB1]
MIQAIIRKGKVLPEEVPLPAVEDGTVLIRVYYSAVSPGTEISSIKGSKTSILKTAIRQPEKVTKYLNKIKTNGLQKIYNEIKSVTDGGMPTGYSVSGEVIAIGKGVTKFAVGEKVAAAGGGFAYHAEFVVVPENLVIKIPIDSDMAEVSTVAIGGIALHGVRRSNLSLGEYGVVFGTGLIGILTVQLLKLSGVKVIAIDIDDNRLEIAKSSGADYTLNSTTQDAVRVVNNLTGGHGCDAVLFTAATDSSEPLSLAFNMIRKKGKLVLVGVSGMDLKREDIYTKEIDFMISSSYGPGRYDKSYEEKNIDYPYPYVRWTENRNMEEYCRLVATGKLNLKPVNYKLFKITEVESAYESLSSGEKKELLVILEYNKDSKYENKKINISSNVKSSLINVAMVGTGSFAQNMHIPNIKKLKDKYNLYAVASRSGQRAKSVSETFGIKIYTSDYEKILNDPYVDLILICNRHGLHFEYAHKALLANKNIFIEKPLCTTTDQLEVLKRIFFNKESRLPFITVGYNRRYSEYALRIKEETMKRIDPLFITYRMNAGYVPKDSWIHEDGGRIIGEACHIVDLMNFLTESKVLTIGYESINPVTENYTSADNKSILLRYEDGSVCNIHYFSNGSKDLSKEYMEVHFDGKSMVMNDYRHIEYSGIPCKPYSTPKIEKGHLEEIKIVADSIAENRLPIQLWDLVQTSEITLSVN